MISTNERNDRRINFDEDERKFSQGSKKSKTIGIFDEVEEDDLQIPDINNLK